MPTLSQSTLTAVRDAAVRDPVSGCWPEQAFEILAEAGLFRWGIPDKFGGIPVTAVEQTAAYIDLADADLAACFVLTQRNSAVSRILSSENATAQTRLLPKLATNELFATVAISHLTTSRQHTKPAVRAIEQNGRFVLNGVCPWATSATRADLLVTGGQCDDGTQVLVAIDARANSDRIDTSETMTLHALNESETGTVGLDHVESELTLAGPVEAVMSQGSGGGTGSLTTSALAVGLSQRALRLLNEEAIGRTDLQAAAGPLSGELAVLRSDLLQTAEGTGLQSSESLRTRANSLALRSTQAYLTATKGAGFLVGHPAERAVREAMFFLVWSCPRPVAEAAMAEFACLTS